MKQLKQLFFRLTTKMFRHSRQPIQPVFHNNINRFMYFPQQRLLQCFLFRIRSHICLLNNTTNTKKEHIQLFRQLGVEFLVRPIHFVHFIRPHESVAQTYREIFKSALVYLSFEIL